MAEDPFFGAYELRLLIFLENEDYTGFHQIMLDSAQFKKVSDAILTSIRKDSSLRDGYDMATLNMDDERMIPASVFEGMNSIND
jgi:hypothetical protein